MIHWSIQKARPHYAQTKKKKEKITREKIYQCCNNKEWVATDVFFFPRSFALFVTPYTKGGKQIDISVNEKNWFLSRAAELGGMEPPYWQDELLAALCRMDEVR